jgi:hypothetical protein
VLKFLHRVVARLVLMIENENRVASSGIMSILNAVKISLKLLVHVRCPHTSHGHDLTFHFPDNVRKISNSAISESNDV